VVWSSSDPDNVTVDQNGLASAFGITTKAATITASSGAIQGTATVHVLPAVLDSLSLLPDNSTLAKGRTQQFTVYPTYSDHSHTPLPAVVWSSSDPDNVTVDQNGLALANGITTKAVTITASSGAIQGTATLAVSPAVLDNLTLSPSKTTLAKGRTQQYTLYPTYSDHTHAPLPAVNWSSSDPDNASVDDSGLVKALELTNTAVTITAASGDIRGSAILSVVESELTSILVIPSNQALAKGRTWQYTVYPTYSDITHTPLPEVSWSSSDPDNATIEDNGWVSARGVTLTPITISATSGDILGTATLEILPAELDDLEIKPTEFTLAKGRTLQYSVSPTYSDDSHLPWPELHWSSSDPDNVTVDQNGLATALGVTFSAVTIRVVSGGVEATVAVSVTPAVLDSIQLIPTEITLAQGRNQQFAVFPTYSDNTHSPVPAVNWSSSDPDNVTVDQNGWATALGASSAWVNITAICGNLETRAAVRVVPPVDLWLAPARLAVGSSDNFSVSIMAQGNSLALDKVRIELNFVPAELEVRDADPAREGIQIVPQTESSGVMVNYVENSTGQIFYEAELTGQSSAENLTLAVIEFRSRHFSDSTAVTFAASSSLQAEGIEVIGTTAGGLYCAFPTVTLTPFNGEKNIKVNSSIELTFSKAMNQTATEGAFSLLPAKEGLFSWSADGKIMTFDPTSNLASNTTYTVGLGIAATDTTGIPLASPLEAVFSTVKNSGSNGGGGGGGGSATTPPLTLTISGFGNNTNLKIDSSGILQADARLQSADGKLTLDIRKGTRLWSPANSVLTTFSAVPLTSPPAAPAGNCIVLAYSLSPQGATFVPGLTLTLSYDPGQLPDGVSESELRLAYWDGAQWQFLESTLDLTGKTASATISHCSSYALIGKINTPAVAVSPSPSPTATIEGITPAPASSPAVKVTTTTPAAKTTPSSAVPTVPESLPAGVNPPTADQSNLPAGNNSTSLAVIIWIGLGVLVVLAVAIIVLRSRRPKKAPTKRK
jgi:hypothetical protein